MYRDKDPDRERLIEVLAEVHGFTLPLRTFQQMAMEQIFHRELDAILPAGWKPDLASLQMQYDSSQAALREVMTRADGPAVPAGADPRRGHGPRPRRRPCRPGS
ncbi:hypothetical protein [Nocardioides mesophilus]|uniref:Uncharacterized protein n=1 Tax=Nocardioides mesophilus TaxID=433659 RepID=A0A7G9RC59_9ACTN|nr:hypothetical protein [Nocardioides mesophilus]QNN53184.1 hypothetical protein H9L09_01430 [Nocardioides mesophilus]